MTEKTAIEHITDNGMGSRTNMFNSLWGGLTALSTAYLGIAEDLSKVELVMIPAVMTFIALVANTWLYGKTHVKHSAQRAVEPVEDNNE